MNDVAVDPTEEPFLAVAVTFGEEKQCDHKGHWHIAPGPYKIVRFCGGCGKSWWIPARDDVLSLSAGERFIQEWEEIREQMEVPPLPASFYDDPQSDEEDMDD